MQNRLKILAGVMVVSAVVAGCARKDTDEKSEDSGKAMANAASAAPVDTKAAEAEIRKGDEDFFNGVKAKDANAVVATYSNDAVSMPPNSPALVGHDAILKYNQDFLKLPGAAMTGGTETVKFSDDGTMAYATGKYSMSYADAKGNGVKDEGKYLEVLKKVDGKWKVIVDMYNSNLAPPK